MALARTTAPSTETSISHRILAVRESGAGTAPAAALAAALTAADLTVSDSFAVAFRAAATAVWTSTCGAGGICDRFSPIDPVPGGIIPALEGDVEPQVRGGSQYLWLI